MFHVLIDTCVWLDLAADPRQRGMLETLEVYMHLGHIQLILPRLVMQEFAMNRERVAKSSARGVTSQVQQVKEAIRTLELNGRRKKVLLAGLDDLKGKLPQLGSAAEEALNYIERHFFRNSPAIEVTDAIKVAAAERALHRKAPCHHDNKNSIADAIILETYAQAVRRSGARERFVLVTHNKNDFSGTDHRKPHDDIAHLFTKIKSLYFVNLSELFARIDPSTWSEIRYEQSWQEEPRGVTEVSDAIDLLTRQVWYNRHKNREYWIDRGKLKVVPREQWEKGSRDNSKEIIDEIWKGALKAAAQTEREVGLENLGPWSDFEWGMINGKLSALRWVLGDEWDMLDT